MAKCMHVCYSLSLEFLKLGTRNGQLFRDFLLSQLLHLCVQGSKLLFQSLRDNYCFKGELKLGQYNMNIMRNSIPNVFFKSEKPAPQLPFLSLSSCLVLLVVSAPLILASHPSLESYLASKNNSLSNFEVTQNLVPFPYNDMSQKTFQKTQPLVPVEIQSLTLSFSPSSTVLPCPKI